MGSVSHSRAVCTELSPSCAQEAQSQRIHTLTVRAKPLGCSLFLEKKPKPNNEGFSTNGEEEHRMFRRQKDEGAGIF